MEPPFYKQILDALSDGVYFVDKERRITFWNNGAERLTGYSADEVLGKSCADNLLMDVDDNGKELCTSGCPLEAVIRDGHMREADVYLHHKFGYRIPIHIKAT
ncbi:MAG: PAS domain-containing protein, partial [Desulfatiglandales bacterium]